MQKKYPVVYSITSFFILFCILFIPFPFYLFPFQQDIAEFVFGRLIGFACSSFFGIHLKSTVVHSDSVSMYMLVLLLFVLSIIPGVLFQHLHRWKQYRERIFHFIQIAGCYYLILMLMKYGLDKVFKTQFYLPEPNTLYTPLGMVDKDLLYWSSMGTSRVYNIFAGSLEVIAALLLLFRKTRMAGSLLAAAIMAQVVMINFGFDISVKLYSLFLLFLCAYLLYPHGGRLWHFFFTQKNDATTHPARLPLLKMNPFASVFAKCLATGLIFFEALYPYIKSRNFNDDVALRPPMHGAYEVQQLIAGNDTASAEDIPVKRFFIHRNGYLIFQDKEDKMQDYKMDYHPSTADYLLTDYQKQTVKLHITQIATDSTVVLRYTKGGVAIQMRGKALDWRKLPALQRSFHWTVDEY